MYVYIRNRGFRSVYTADGDDVEGGEIKGCRPPNQIGPRGWAPLQHLNAHLDIFNLSLSLCFSFALSLSHSLFISI